MTEPQLPEGWRMEKVSGSNWPLYIGPEGERQYWYPGELAKGFERHFRNNTHKAYYTRNTPPLLNDWVSKKSSKTDITYYFKKGANKSQFNRPGELPPGWKYTTYKKDYYKNNTGKIRNSGPIGPTQEHISGPRTPSGSPPESPKATSLTSNTKNSTITTASYIKYLGEFCIVLSEKNNKSQIQVKYLRFLSDPFYINVKDAISVSQTQNGICTNFYQQLLHVEESLIDIEPEDNLDTLEKIERWITLITNYNPEGIDILNTDGAAPDVLSLEDNFFKIDAKFLEKDGTAKLELSRIMHTGYKEKGYFASNQYKSYIEQLQIKDFKITQNNGGISNDCLIIAFLFSVSDGFRKASYDIKYKIANTFRRKYLIALPQFSQVFKDNKVSASIAARGWGFLDDLFGEVLKMQYNIHILFLEGIKTGNSQGIQVVQPPSVVFNEKKDADSGIIIFNRGNNHFESTYHSDSSISLNRFIFFTGDIEWIQ